MLPPIIVLLAVASSPCGPENLSGCDSAELMKMCERGKGAAAGLACTRIDLGRAATKASRAPLLARACELGVVDACYEQYWERFVRADDPCPRSGVGCAKACAAGANEACGYFGASSAEETAIKRAACAKGLPFGCERDELRAGCLADGFGAAEKCVSYVAMHLARASANDGARAPFLVRGCDLGAQAACWELGLDRLYHQPAGDAPLTLVRDLSAALPSLRKACMMPLRAQMFAPPFDAAETYAARCALVAELDEGAVLCLGGDAASCLRSARLLDPRVAHPESSKVGFSTADATWRRALLERACALGDKSACADPAPPASWPARPAAPPSPSSK